MNIELEKKLIIAEINHIDDEWLLTAIKGLLGMNDVADISDAHKSTLDARLEEYNNGAARTVSLVEAKMRLLGR